MCVYTFQQYRPYITKCVCIWFNPWRVVWQRWWFFSFLSLLLLLWTFYFEHFCADDLVTKGKHDSTIICINISEHYKRPCTSTSTLASRHSARCTHLFAFMPLATSYRIVISYMVSVDMFNGFGVFFYSRHRFMHFTQFYSSLRIICFSSLFISFVYRIYAVAAYGLLLNWKMLRYIEITTNATSIS